MMAATARPAHVPVSMPSRKARNKIWRSPSSAMVRMTSATERPSLSMAVTTPRRPQRGRKAAGRPRPVGLVFTAPESLSVKTWPDSKPWAASAASWTSRSWPVVLTPLRKIDVSCHASTVSLPSDSEDLRHVP